MTSITWIPSEAITGAARLPFAMHMAHYDDPPPDALDASRTAGQLDELRVDDRFRFANHLTAWIDVDDSEIVGWGQRGGGIIGGTTLSLGAQLRVAAVPYDDIRPQPDVGEGWVRFRQSAGGRTGVPAPRHVNRPPFVQIVAPTAWTTLELTIHADGHTACRLVGASPFPRHWLYDNEGQLVGKSGLIDFRHWYREAFGAHSPWGGEDSPALATAAETALERQLATVIMRGGRKPRIRQLRPDETLLRQGDDGDDLFLLLDGVIGVDVDGARVAELGPGAVLGERAVLAGGARTATLVALTRCKVAVARAGSAADAALVDLRGEHRREDAE